MISRNRTGHTDEVVPVEEKDHGTRTTAAFATVTFSDVIYHTLTNGRGFALGRSRHSRCRGEIPETDKLMRYGGKTTCAGCDYRWWRSLTAADSCSSRRWLTQMVVYRKDLFDAAGLAAPTSDAAIEVTDAPHNPLDDGFCGSKQG